VRLFQQDLQGNAKKRWGGAIWGTK